MKKTYVARVRAIEKAIDDLDPNKGRLIFFLRDDEPAPPPQPGEKSRVIFRMILGKDTVETDSPCVVGALQEARSPEGEGCDKGDNRTPGFGPPPELIHRDENAVPSTLTGLSIDEVARMAADGELDFSEKEWFQRRFGPFGRR
jgi:hypothetical protein